MGVEMCTRCDAHVDLDYNTNGEYFENNKGTSDFVCENCLTEPELDAKERALYEDSLREMNDDEHWISYKMGQYDDEQKEDDKC